MINIYLNISPVNTGYGHNEARTYIVLIRDITKEKSLEEERDEFISVVSHELRTPVAIAEGNVGNAQFIAKKEGASQPILEMLTTAHSQILFLSDLLNDLSMLSRAERGNLEITLETIDIKSLVNELQTTYSPDAAQHGLKFTVKHGEHLPKIKNSELYVREILQNFITNAIKYTREGSVTVTTKAVDKNSVEISVKDSGIGMSPHDLKHIFEKFYRSEDYRTRESSGTGLGLYVTRKLLEMTKAQLNVTSKLNEGSTFTIVLSSIAATAPESSEDAQSDAA
jgi:signal transduction histidine kinase